MGHIVPKLSKITLNMTFEHFSNISTSQKLEFNTFSGSTNLWRLSEDYEPLLYVLLRYSRGKEQKSSGNWSTNSFI